MADKDRAQIGVIGGSGFYELFDKAKKLAVKTPYGSPSDKIAIAEVMAKKVAFLPRHGKGHKFPPQFVPYRANIYALKSLGVERIIAPSASGSLKAKIKPGDFVLCDQFVNFTHARSDTFFEGEKTINKFSKGNVVHISSDTPYCPQLRRLAANLCKKLKLRHHNKGTVTVINGPRFSTKAESLFFQNQGWDVINMTQYPEVILAREMEICYLNISLITDYDVGLKGQKKIMPVTTEEVLKVFRKNNENVRKLILHLIEVLPEKRECNCDQALKTAVVN